MNFTDQLMEAKRRARLSGRPISQQEIAGITEGYASGASDRVARSKTLAMQERQIENQEGQFAENLALQERQTANQETQFNETFGETQRQFGENLALAKQAAGQRAAEFEKTYGLSMQQAEAQAGQFEKTFGLSVTTAKQQNELAILNLNAQIAHNTAVMKQNAYQFEQNYGLATWQTQAQIDAANEARAKQTGSTVGGGVGMVVGGVVGGVLGGIGTYGFGAPAGAMGGATVGGALGTTIGGMIGCIIISACTSKDSYEVNIARQFRDKYMDEKTLTGYYALCVFVVPFIKRYPLVRRIVKKALVDRLVDYGEWRLGIKPDMKYSTSGVAKKLFLGLCRHVGRGVNTVLEVSHG